MNVKSGFSTLELIMVMAISAIIMTCLLEIYNQVGRNMIRVERFVFEDTQLLTLKNRLEKDLSGLSAIWFTQADVEEKKAAGAEQKNVSTTDKKKSSRYFYSVNKNGHLDTLTFVTTNGLQSYGSLHNRFVRVVYQVEPDLAHEGMLRLMRKEIMTPTENIDEASLSEGKFYELVDGIMAISITFQLVDVIELKKQAAAAEKDSADKSAAPKEKEEKKLIIRSVTQWIEKVKTKKDSQASAGDEANSNKAEDEDLGGAAVPKFIEMKIVFGVTDKQVKKEYKIDFCIPSNIDNIPKAPSKEAAPAPTPIQ